MLVNPKCANSVQWFFGYNMFYSSGLNTLTKYTLRNLAGRNNRCRPADRENVFKILYLYTQGDIENHVRFLASTVTAYDR